MAPEPPRRDRAGALVTPAEERLLDRLRRLNDGLAEWGCTPLFRDRVAEALDYCHLQVAVDLTEVELIRVTRVLQEGGGA